MLGLCGVDLGSVWVDQTSFVSGLILLRAAWVCRVGLPFHSLSSFSRGSTSLSGYDTELSVFFFLV